MRTRFLRLLIGLAVLALLLPLLFAITIPLIHRWGATHAEVAQPLPGDELLTFVQPPLWVRLALNGALIGGIWWALGPDDV